MQHSDTEQQGKPSMLSDEIKILLIGNPNVGKSVLFSKLTGMDVLAANYAGTTVDVTSGKVNYRGKKATLIDVPGTYSLDATSPAEEIAVKLLNEGAHVVLCVLDSTNLERNLNLALQLKQFNIPMIFALNMLDVAERKGIAIDVKVLEEELQAPVIPIIAIRNIGLSELLDKVWTAASYNITSQDKTSGVSQSERWQEIGRIVEKVQKVDHRKPTFWEKAGDLTIQPFPGIPIALLVLLASIAVVVGGGMALRVFIFLPLINDGIVPIIVEVVSGVVPEGIWRNILVGEFGMLVKGLEWPIALILPYVTLFYIVMSFLEDSGYLPRLGVLMDSTLRKMHIQGGNIVPMFMGYGCAVPAILGTRAATSYKERLMVLGLIVLAVPCVAQTGAFIAMLGERSIIALLLIYMLSFAAMVVAGMVMNRVIPGKIDPLLIEIPNLLKPHGPTLLKKIWMRLKQFLWDAQVPMVLAIGFAALVAETGVLEVFSIFLEPLVVGWLGLPKEASLALVLGLIRRELAVLPLVEMDLTTLQLFVGSVVALFYLPCLTALAIIIKEFNLKIAFYVMFFTISIAFLVAGLINQIASIFI